ncbi:RodZ domain-containing protein [Sphingomonas sp. 1P08PE]|uniref:helix-turn-helix domain-containing protein n=1 Tax=Sphingomonas sp. 1P08PE TaxID=554122 RepID=UPI0039A345A8
MTEVEPGDTPAPERVGDRLRKAREAQGLSLAEVGSRTRVPLRHLEAIESTDFALLPSPTYAVGFARAYARAVGLDDASVAHDVRGELAQVPRAPEYEPYETADLARVPSRGIAILGLGLAVAILVLAGLYYATDLFRPGAGGPAIVAAPPAVTAPVAVAPAPSPTPAAGPVTLTAGDNEVWLRVYDAANTTLYLGTLKPGESFEVPATADAPKINVGRPDQLRVAVGGTAIPPLGDGSRPIKDVAVDAAALLARAGQGGGAPAVSPSPTAAPLVAPTTAALRRTPRAAATGRPLTETQRANLQSAQNPPPVAEPEAQ